MGGGTASPLQFLPDIAHSGASSFTLYPYLSLEDVNLDTELAQRLSRRLAYYHLALPIAQDSDGVTVAMAHPENQKVLGVLEAAMNAKVIPVRSSTEMIRQQLDRVWDVQNASGTLRVALWTQDEALLDRSEDYLDHLLDALERDAQIERSTGDTPSNADLIVAVTDQAPLPQNLFRASASVLVLGAASELPKSILHILRGHNPDYLVLDWLKPLARNNAASITLLMSVDGTKPLVSDLSSILMGQDKRQAHLAECRRQLAEAGIDGRLKLRQEALLTAIRSEVSEHPYDLVALAAEAYGDFALQVGELVRAQTPAFLVIKP